MRRMRGETGRFLRRALAERERAELDLLAVDFPADLEGAVFADFLVDCEFSGEAP